MVFHRKILLIGLCSTRLVMYTKEDKRKFISHQFCHIEAFHRFSPFHQIFCSLSFLISFSHRIINLLQIHPAIWERKLSKWCKITLHCRHTKSFEKQKTFLRKNPHIQIFYAVLYSCKFLAGFASILNAVKEEKPQNGGATIHRTVVILRS